MSFPDRSISTNNCVLIVGCDMPYGAALCERLRSDGYEISGVAYGGFQGKFPAFTLPASNLASLAATLQQRLPGFRPQRIVMIPRRAALAEIADIAAEDFIAMADETLVGAEVLARFLVSTRTEGQPARLVLLSAWAALGLPGASTSAAVMGGLLGLTRSWALELGASGITVNAVIAGAGVEGSGWDAAQPAIGRHPSDEEIAHAVAFLLDERSSGISGQVLSVCGGLTPGIIPV